KSADQLKAERKTVRIKATGQTDRRMTGHIERHCPGKPTRPNVAEYPAVDFYRAEQVLIDRKRGAGDGWHRENIDLLQQRLNPPEQSRAVKHRPLIVNTADFGGQRQLLHESLAEHVAMIGRQLLKPRAPRGVIDRAPDRLDLE